MTFAEPTSRRVHARAPGKINLFFAVGDPAPDGYHDVASLYQALSLTEDVWAATTPFAGEITVAVDGDVDVTGVPLDDANLAVRAARVVAGHAAFTGGIHLQIHKGVPVAAGMGGGSADAAAALVAVNELLEAGLTSADLQALAADLGADVPFALLGGTAIGTGRGDRLAPALARGRFDWVLVTGGELSTPDVYGQLDRMRAASDIAPTRAPVRVDPGVLQALRAGEPSALAVALHNDLQDAALALRPDLADLLSEGMNAGGLAALVSGSGPTVAFLAADERRAREAAARLSRPGRPARTAHGPVPGARILVP